MARTAIRTTYEAVPAAMGWAIVMRAPEGAMTVEAGIKRWDTAKKRAAAWQKREDAAAPTRSPEDRD